MELLDKIELLKVKFGGTVYDGTIDAWQKEAQRLIILSQLSDNEAIKFINNKIQNDLESIKVALGEDRDMDQETRLAFIDVKHFYEWWAKIFAKPDKQLENLTKRIDENL